MLNTKNKIQYKNNIGLKDNEQLLPFCLQTQVYLTA